MHSRNRLTTITLYRGFAYFRNKITVVALNNLNFFDRKLYIWERIYTYTAYSVNVVLISLVDRSFHCEMYPFIHQNMHSILNWIVQKRLRRLVAVLTMSLSIYYNHPINYKFITQSEHISCRLTSHGYTRTSSSRRPRDKGSRSPRGVGLTILCDSYTISTGNLFSELNSYSGIWSVISVTNYVRDYRRYYYIMVRFK